MSIDDATEKTEAAPRHRRVRGWWIVLAILSFGLILTGINWAYWKRHIAPFLPLQKRLAEEYRGSKPRVEGGQRKIHQATPKILRVTMMLDFNPETEAGKPKAERFAKDVAAFIAREWSELTEYDLLELHLYWPEPEQEIRSAVITFEVAKLTAER